MGSDTETMELIVQIRSGNRGAWSRLVERELPPLKRYAQGRLPTWARSASDTQDLVQNVLMRALPRLVNWESQGRGALRAFLRKALINQIVDEIRKARKRMASPTPLEGLPDAAPSPLSKLIQGESVMKLRKALARLSESDRKLLAARFGSGCRYTEIATLLDRPSANAARMAVERAVERLAKIMNGTSRVDHATRARLHQPPVTRAMSPAQRTGCRRMCDSGAAAVD